MQHIQPVTSRGDSWPLNYAPDVAMVIGAGADGLKAARTLVSYGLKVSVFDRGAVPVTAASFDCRSLLRSPDVRVVGRVDVIDILDTPYGAVRGVRARLDGLHDAEFFADLVIDASGGESRFDGWRGCVGYARPEDVDLLMEQFCGLALAR